MLVVGDVIHTLHIGYEIGIDLLFEDLIILGRWAFSTDARNLWLVVGELSWHLPRGAHVTHLRTHPATSGRLPGGSGVLNVTGDLFKLPVELTITTGGVFGRKLTAAVDGLDGAPCPIELI